MSLTVGGVIATPVVPSIIAANKVSLTLTFRGGIGLMVVTEPELNISAPIPSNISAVAVLVLKATVSVIGGLALVGTQLMAGGVPATPCPDARTVYPAEV